MVSLLVALALLGSAFAAPPDDSNCGKPYFTPSLGNTFEDRIVGGKEAVKNSWPWQIQVRYNGGHFCGASILSTDTILSAGHCFKGYATSSFSFRAGRHTQSGVNEAYEQAVTARTVTIHESYSSITLNNDLAIIRVTPSLTYSNGVKAVCLPTRSTELAEGTQVHITGWGATENTGSNSVLRQVQVPIVGRTKCNQRDFYNGEITSGMICAGLDAGGYDSCQGDSGGPLVAPVGAGGLWEQYGVVSWGYGCADAKKPGVYSNVHYYESWIRSKVTQMDVEEALVQAKFRPVPAGAAFREQAREAVLRGEIDASELPLNGEWLE